MVRAAGKNQIILLPGTIIDSKYDSRLPVQENSNQQLEMHIRIKRAKTVLFLYVDPSETIRDVKNKIEALLGQVGASSSQSLTSMLALWNNDNRG